MQTSNQRGFTLVELLVVIAIIGILIALLLLPMQDKPGLSYFYAFGSAHPAGANYLKCDGSINSIAYEVDMNIFLRLCNRKDGETIVAGYY